MGKHIRTFSIIALAALLIAACGQANQTNTISYTLKTDLQNGQMVYVGVGDGIDGVVNPTLIASVNSVVELKLINGDGAEHNINFPDFNTSSANVSGKGNSVTVAFGVDKAGKFAYFDNQPGHREAGMQGELDVEDSTASNASYASAATSASTAASSASDSPTATAGMDMSGPQRPHRARPPRRQPARTSSATQPTCPARSVTGHRPPSASTSKQKK